MKHETEKPDIQKTALRLPRELHTAIIDSRQKSGRTMNAEIVHRLERSFATELEKDVLLKAEDAAIAATEARLGMSTKALNYVVEAINKAITAGRLEAYVDFENELGLDSDDELYFSNIVDPIVEQLKEHGYKADFFDRCTLHIEFSEVEFGS